MAAAAPSSRSFSKSSPACWARRTDSSEFRTLQKRLPQEENRCGAVVSECFRMSGLWVSAFQASGENSTLLSRVWPGSRTTPDPQTPAACSPQALKRQTPKRKGSPDQKQATATHRGTESPKAPGLADQHRHSCTFGERERESERASERVSVCVCVCVVFV